MHGLRLSIVYWAWRSTSPRAITRGQLPRGQLRCERAITNYGNYRELRGNYRELPGITVT